MFRRLSEENIPYCILRNYDTLPDINPGSDIDMLIAKDKLLTAHNIFTEMEYALNIRILQIIKREHVIQIRLYQYLSVIDHFFLQIDVHCDEKYLGAVYLNGDDILQHKRLHNTFYVPSLVHEAIISLFSKLLVSGSVKDKYKDFIKSVIIDNEKEFIKVLSDIIKPLIAFKVVGAIKNNEWGKLAYLQRSICSSLWINAFLRNPYDTGINFFKVCFYALKYRMFPTGIVVCILGIDGSGKSTIAGKAMKILNKAFPSDANCILHWRPNLLPALRTLYGKKDEDYNKHITISPQSRVFALLRFLYYMVDIILGYYLKVYHLARQNALVIFDRYAYDFYVDPHRYGFNIPDWILKIFSLIIPSPNLVIYLETPSEILSKRKNELTIEEINRNIENFRLLLPKLPNLKIINTDKPLNLVLDDVIVSILKRAENITSNKLQLIKKHE